MSNLKTIRCPHCTFEFTLDLQAEIERSRLKVFRMTTAKPNGLMAGPVPEYIVVECRNPKCGKSFKISTAGA